jgi:hypothetical protein
MVEGALPNEPPVLPAAVIHDGRRHLGHLARPHEQLPLDLPVARTLVIRPDSLVLLAEALNYEELVLFGRALLRRLERAA